MSKVNWDNFYWGDGYGWKYMGTRGGEKKITPKAVNWVSTNILQKIREEYDEAREEEDELEIIEMIEEGDEELAEALEMTVKELQEAFEKGGLEWLWDDLYEDLFVGGNDE
mgnify:CR=1 FL=1